MSLDIIMGNMFSGKTSELIRQLKRYKIIGSKILVINSSKDTRSNEEVLKTHDNVTFQCIKTNALLSLLREPLFEEAEVIAIDEAQFFTNLKAFTEECLINDKHVLMAGLDGDYKQRKFGEMIDCIPLADTVKKLKALCTKCNDGTPGPFTVRTVSNDDLILVGDTDMYTARCRKHLDA
jgi:thymidine kinase